MAENFINFPKKRFDGCDLLPRTQPRTENKLDMVITFYVKNYRKLKKNIIYYTSAEICGYWWTTKFVIVNGTLFSFISTNANVQNPISRIYKVRGNFTLNNNFKQIGSLLILEFCHKAIIDSKNEYLHCDRLLIEFKFEMERSKNEHCSTDNSSFQTLIDRHAHCDDFKDLYLPYLRSDLTIYVDDLRVDCHISFLTERSKYLADFFEKNQPLSNKRTCIEIDDEPDLYEHVINYIYTGVLNCLDDVEDMREVYGIANILQVDSLQKICKAYFETNFISK